MTERKVALVTGATGKPSVAFLLNDFSNGNDMVVAAPGIETLADLKGLRIRVQGLGGDVYLELGATPQAIPPGDVYPALERGTIDAVELLSPANDLPLGFHKVAPVYHMPGFNKPNGAAEALVSLKAWQSLPRDLQAIVEGLERRVRDWVAERKAG